MMWRIIIVSFGIACSLGLHPARAQDQAGTIQLIANTPITLPTLSTLPATVGGDLQTTGAFDTDTSYRLSARPAEFSFTELLLDRNADPRDSQPSVALARAIALRDLPLLQRLLDDGADPNAALPQPAPAWLSNLFDDPFPKRELAKDSRVTPLVLAVLTRQPDAVRLLLQRGANKEISTRTLHWYPLDFAAELKNIPIMQLLLGQEPTADGAGRHVVISLYAQKAWLMTNGGVTLESEVSTGRAGYATKTGEYVVTQKYPSWKSTLYKVAMPDFMRLNCSQAGMHAGVVPGVPASHGCIRLPPDKAELFYGAVQLGDRVTIVE